MVTVYVSIGNSDDKLNQEDWSRFQDRLLAEVMPVGEVHGVWYSLPNSPFQNMCVCADIYHDAEAAELKVVLARLAAEFRQLSIAWAEVPETEFITPADGSVPPGRNPSDQGGQ